MIRASFVVLGLLQLATSSAVPDATSSFRYRRDIQFAAAGQTCVALDAATFSHAAPFLKDLRVVANAASVPLEVPYVITVSEPQQTEIEAARILNLRKRGRALEFDLAMPARPYSEVDLDLAGQDFVATVSVAGSSTPGSSHRAQLGQFNLFDLTAQHLSRSTAVRLQETSFPFLHMTLNVFAAGHGSSTPIAEMIRGATVPPSRQAQTLFTVAAETAVLKERRNQTVASFKLGPRIPIERVAFALAPGFHANFSRDVLVDTYAPSLPPGVGDSVAGTIQRVRLNRAGIAISAQQLSIPATLGANLQEPADVEVAVTDGNSPPLPIAAVQLEMRRRDLCFQAPAGVRLTLFYGDSNLPAPAYDIARTYTPSAPSAAAELGPEQRNPAWHPPTESASHTRRQPHMLWIEALVAVCILALLTLRAAHPRRHHYHQR